MPTHPDRDLPLAPGFRLLWLAALLWLSAPRAALALDPAKAISQYGHDAWTTEKGLPASAIFEITQTTDGYLWIGTPGGLVRFDGFRFVTFSQRDTPGLTNHEIRALAPRREGGLWVGTWKGLFLLEGGRATAVPVYPDDPDLVIESLREARDGTLWVGTQGQGVFGLRDSRKLQFTHQQGLPNDYVWALAEDRQGDLWIGTMGGLARLRSGKLETFEAVREVSGCSIGALFAAPDGSVWIAGNGRLSRWQADRFQHLGPEAGLLKEFIDSLWVDRHGSVWIGSRGGLSRLHQGRSTHFLPADGLSDRLVHALWEDHEGSLWVGTRGGGLERFRDGKFTIVGKSEGMPDDSVHSILEDESGAFWIGTRSGLVRLRDGRLETWAGGRRHGGLPVDFVTALVERRNGEVWVGTAAGLGHPWRGRFKILLPDDPRLYSYVSTLYEDNEGALWIGDPGGGLHRFHHGELRTFGAADGLASDHVYAVIGRRSGGLWIATLGHGVFRYAGGKFTSFSREQGLPDNSVYGLYEDSAGTLWIGTASGGLAWLEGERVSSVDARRGLWDDSIYSILDDDLGNLWLGSTRGLFRVAKAELRAVAEGRKARLTSTGFGTADGLRSSELVAGSTPNFFRSRDGRLWFATTRGAASIDPQNVPINAVPPPVLIEQVRVNGEATPVAPDQRLPPGSRRLQIDYTALTFLAADRVHFEVQLEGFDRDWVDMGSQRTATYTNLPPGSYRFRVKAANADGVWSQEEASLAFAIEPHFYQTTWFYLLLAASLAALAWGVYRLRVRSLEARYAAVLAERARIARELHDTVAQDLVAAALQLDSLPGGEPEGDPLAEVKGLVRGSLTATRRSVAVLRQPVFAATDLASVLRHLGKSVARATGLEVEVEVQALPRSLPPAVEENLYRIAQEALANTSRHAQARRIQLRLGRDNGWLRLEVRDDGRGFEPAQAGDSSREHFGLVGMRERAEALGGRIELDSRPGAGTRLVVEVPWSDAAAPSRVIPAR